MRKIKAFMGISALAVIAVTAFQLNTTAASAASMSQADIACRIALNKGTAEALTAFLKRYPNAGTACNASDTTADVGGPVIMGGTAPPVVPPSSTGSGGGTGGSGGGDDDHHHHHHHDS